MRTWKRRGSAPQAGERAGQSVAQYRGRVQSLRGHGTGASATASRRVVRPIRTSKWSAGAPPPGTNRSSRTGWDWYGTVQNQRRWRTEGRDGLGRVPARQTLRRAGAMWWPMRSRRRRSARSSGLVGNRQPRRDLARSSWRWRRDRMKRHDRPGPCDGESEHSRQLRERTIVKFSREVAV